MSAILSDDGGVRDLVAKALEQMEGQLPFENEAGRLRDVLAELDDLADAVRTTGETIEHDPETLDRVQARRQQLLQLRRKYGDDLVAVMAEQRTLEHRLGELETWEERAVTIEGDLAAAHSLLREAQAAVLEARRRAAPELAAAITEHLPDLAMAKARIEIAVGGPDGSEVAFLLSANPGSPPKPLTRVASGGELARRPIWRWPKGSGCTIRPMRCSTATPGSGISSGNSPANFEPTDWARVPPGPWPTSVRNCCWTACSCWPVQSRFCPPWLG